MRVLLTVIFYMFITIGVINMVHIAAFLVGANFYDAGLAAAVKRYRLSRRRRRVNPLISVLIPAFNEEKVIKRCLDSIKKNTYKKIEVIVNNDASRDATAKIVRLYQKKHPRFPLRLVSRRINRGKANGINYIAKRYAAGDLVMTLDADSLLQKNALKNVVKYFDSPRVVGIAANVRIIEDHGPLALLQRFEHLISYRSKKLYSLINCELIVGGVASTYRRSVLKKVRFYDTDTVTEDIGLSVKIAASGNKENKLMYAPDVVAMTEGVGDFKGLLNQRYRWKLGNLQNLFKYRRLLFSLNPKYTKTLTWYRVPMSFLGEIFLLLEPFLLIYIIALSIRFLNPIIIISAYGSLTAYLMLVIWPDEHMTKKNKLKASLYTPLMYFVFYIMNAVQIISALRCIKNTRRVIRLSGGTNAWVSPKRSGKAAPFGNL